jgi:hypothetical protein
VQQKDLTMKDWFKHSAIVKKREDLIALILRIQHEYAQIVAAKAASLAALPKTPSVASSDDDVVMDDAAE